ncbi:MAG: hypothetical protein AB7O43_16205 [Hyphomicrobiaceae bacterium]
MQHPTQSRKTASARSRRRRKPPKAAEGRLILVVGADPVRLDLLLDAARRRLLDHRTLTFAQPMSTRRLPTGAAALLTLSGFLSMKSSGDLILSWRSGGAAYGHCASLLNRLADGETVVAGANAEAVAEARRHCQDARIVRVTATTDKVRSALTPRACMSRMMDQRTPGIVASFERMFADRLDAEVREETDFARTVVELSEAISALAPAPAASGQAKPSPRLRAAPLNTAAALGLAIGSVS